jgi:hypothetical protein
VYAALTSAPITTNYDLSYVRLLGGNGFSADATSGSPYAGATFTPGAGVATFTATRATDAIVTAGLATNGGPTTDGVDGASLAVYINGTMIAVSTDTIYGNYGSSGSNQTAAALVKVATGDVVSIRVNLTGAQAVVNLPSSYASIKPLI